MNLSNGKQLKVVGVATPIAHSSWIQINFFVEPTKEKTKSLILELSLQNKVITEIT